jgi:ribosomal protein S18 acetylase RimI-like enzyme
MEIRRIAADEFDYVGELTSGAYLSGPEGERARAYVPSLRDVAPRAAHASVLVAVDSDRIIGTVTYVPARSPYAEFDDEDAVGIRMRAVHPTAQRLGVGRALVEECLRLARAEGRARVVLHTAPWMTAAKRLYERLGFERAPERDWRPRPEVQLIGYVLELPDA